MYLRILCASENKQRLFHYTALTDWFLQQRRSVYCAVRAESLNTIQIARSYIKCRNPRSTSCFLCSPLPSTFKSSGQRQCPPRHHNFLLMQPSQHNTQSLSSAPTSAVHFPSLYFLHFLVPCPLPEARTGTVVSPATIM